MAIYAISGAPRSGRTTLAKRLVGDKAVWDVSDTRRRDPEHYLDALRNVIASVIKTPAFSRFALDGIEDSEEVKFLRVYFPEQDVVHYHITTGDLLYEPTFALAELALAADYAITWKKRNG